MTASRIRRRWTRLAIALLILMNTALWASFAVAGHHGQAKGRASSSQSRELR